ncbi:MAG: 1-acyl-sn-glycerol-3-phosphate acyltransferase [Candidatus Hodarchaeota archaeon]
MIHDIIKIFREKANPLTRKALEKAPRISFFSAKFNRFRILLALKIVYFFFRLKNRLEIQNKHILEKLRREEKDFLVIANHSCLLDVIIHQAVHIHINHMVFSFINSGGFNLLGIPIVPTVLHFSELVPRHGTGQHCVDRMVSRLARGDHVLLFPEGSYNRGLVTEGYNGVSRVAYGYEQLTGKKLKILPVCTIGGHIAYPPKGWYRRRWRRKHRKRHHHHHHRKFPLVKARGGQKMIFKFGEPFTLHFSENPSKDEHMKNSMVAMHEIAGIWGQKKIYKNQSRIWRRMREKKPVKSRYYVD